MALISAKTILTSLCFFHITLGFFFLTNPNTVADQPMVQLLGESMGLVCLIPIPMSLARGLFSSVNNSSS